MQLDGIRVLDFTRLLPGPCATQLLADNGAEVIKIEDTGMGDYARAMPPHSERGVGALFDMVNRGKRSVALDLKTSAGRNVIHELVGTADVLIEGDHPRGRGRGPRRSSGRRTSSSRGSGLASRSASGSTTKQYESTTTTSCTVRSPAAAEPVRTQIAPVTT